MNGPRGRKFAGQFFGFTFSQYFFNFSNGYLFCKKIKSISGEADNRFKNTMNQYH